MGERNVVAVFLINKKTGERDENPFLIATILPRVTTPSLGGIPVPVPILDVSIKIEECRNADVQNMIILALFTRFNGSEISRPATEPKPTKPPAPPANTQPSTPPANDTEPPPPAQDTEPPEPKPTPEAKPTPKPTPKPTRK